MSYSILHSSKASDAMSDVGTGSGASHPSSGVGVVSGDNIPSTTPTTHIMQTNAQYKQSLHASAIDSHHNYALPKQQTSLSAANVASTDFFAATALSELAQDTTQPSIQHATTAADFLHQEPEQLSKAVNGALEMIQALSPVQSASGVGSVHKGLEIARAHLTAAAAVLAANSPELDLPATGYGISGRESQGSGSMPSVAVVAGQKRPRRASTVSRDIITTTATTTTTATSKGTRAMQQASKELEERRELAAASKSKRMRKIGAAERKVHGEGHLALHNAKNPWAHYEDALLRDAFVRITSESLSDRIPWHKIAELVPDRTGKQCRDRWIHHLQPHVNKSEWTVREDGIIFEKLKTVGRRWATIAAALPGRTPQQVKNRYYATMRRLARRKIREETGDIVGRSTNSDESEDMDSDSEI